MTAGIGRSVKGALGASAGELAATAVSTVPAENGYNRSCRASETCPGVVGGHPGSDCESLKLDLGNAGSNSDTR